MDVKKNIALSTSLHLVMILLMVMVRFYAGVVIYIILHRIAKGQLFQLAGYSLHTIGHQDLRLYSAVIITLTIILPMFILTALVRMVIVTKEILLIEISSIIYVLIMLMSI
jgi:NADH:ubiquinone oxidoreductase subunit 5 (subunit L)/multisubunit Na+/H+ antiporter MnhA subunit